MKKFYLLVVCCLFSVAVHAQSNGFMKSIEANGNVGLDDCVKYSFGLNFVGGYKLGSFFFGAGVGYSYLEGLYYTSYEYLGKGDSYRYKSYDVRNNINLFARLKANMTQSRISPFLQVDLGGTLGLSSNKIRMANGYMFEPAFGCDFTLNDMQSIFVMLGYKGQQYQYEAFDTTYGSAGNETRKKMAGAFCLHIGFNF